MPGKLMRIKADRCLGSAGLYPGLLKEVSTEIMVVFSVIYHNSPDSRDA